MIVYAEVECLLYNVHSLKQKRSQLKRLFHQIKKDFNVSLAEIDYHDLWQRTKFGIAIVTNEYTYGEKVMHKVFDLIDASLEVERTLTSLERL